MNDDVSTEVVSDDDIVLLMMEKKEEGLRHLLRIHGPKVLGALRSKFYSVLQFVDVEQALFIAAQKAWERIDSFDEKRTRSLRAWFYRIAENCAFDICRREKRHFHYELPDQVEDESVRAPCSDEEGDEVDPGKEALHKALYKAINRLPHMQREIVKADLLAGGTASGEELARRLGTSKNSVYVSRKKAREKLRKECKEVFEGTRGS